MGSLTARLVARSTESLGSASHRKAEVGQEVEIKQYPHVKIRVILLVKSGSPMKYGASSSPRELSPDSFHPVKLLKYDFIFFSPLLLLTAGMKPPGMSK